MHLLKRKISPYTDSDQCLGVFATAAEASSAAGKYISLIESGELPDPWAEQAYHSVSLQSDLCVLSSVPLREVPAAARQVYVVSSVSEAFGQFVREFVAICGSEESASRAVAEVEEQESEFPFSGEYEVFELGALRTPAVGA
jgi:hypothetical protein